MSIIALAKKKQQTLLDFEPLAEDKHTETPKVGVPFVPESLENIVEMLPALYDHQQEDVLKAEVRFATGKGYLFTNGTGTGKTYVGLGILKRFYVQGKREILVVVPTEAKSIDWMQDALDIDIRIKMLDGIHDCGSQVVVTTYANFYQNDALELREWDLIIYDESHYLNQNSQGDPTVYFDKHKRIANLPSAAKSKAREIIGPTPEYETDSGMWEYRAEAWKNQTHHYIHHFVNRTKVVFLSATPFAYHKSIKYADGTLFDINETIMDPPPPSGYNGPGRWEKFMIENFGYHMKYNKLTMPDVGVDQGLMERNFFEKYATEGRMSTRILELDYDYSREFIILDSELGNFIDSGIDLWSNHEHCKKYPNLADVISAKYNYNYVNQLLETIKAKEVIPRIRKHLALGRKVVIFHGYNHTTMEHPFKFDPMKILAPADRWQAQFLKPEIAKFEQEFPQYVNLDLNDLMNTRKTIRNAFPDVVEINGTVAKKKRQKNKDDFNSDYSGVNLILVQEKAGREGISLHDETGKHPRIIANLSLPVAPTAAIQTEGRIYRSGLRSNCAYEYPTLHTNFEKRAFADKIAVRAKTAENLAMGNLARDLETAFKEGFINAIIEDPHIGQGIGGKDKDRILNTISDFEKAKTYYYSRGKRTAKNKSFEGIDYFATPEPFGYMMVKWLNPLRLERGLEPSAGHGAIARWFPAFTDNVFVEPSTDLYSEMKIITSGDTKNDIFDYYYVGNKFDYIAMNPPFGKGGVTAVEHISKAIKQLATRQLDLEHNGSRLLSIVPNGSSCNRRLEALYESKEFRDFYLTGEMILPSCLFTRAGTNVSTKLIRIEHVNTGNTQLRQLDYSYCETIEEFFDIIEELNF